VKVYEDAGIGGAKGRDKRPGFDAMLKAVNAKEFEVVAAWSVDRLGRSLTDLLGILQGLHEEASLDRVDDIIDEYLSTGVGGHLPAASLPVRLCHQDEAVREI
jgi:Resolvase, N terminal domain